MTAELEAVDDVMSSEMTELDAVVHRLGVVKQQQMELLLEAAKEREEVRQRSAHSPYMEYLDVPCPCLPLPTQTHPIDF